MFSWILENSLVVGALALAMCAAARWMRTRPAVVHAFWLVLLVRLLVPPLSVDLALPRELPGPSLAAAAERTGEALWTVVPRRAAPGEPAATPASIASVEAVAAGEVTTAPALSSPIGPAPPPSVSATPAAALHVTDLLFAAWLAGALVAALRQARNARRFQRRLAAGAAPSAALARTVSTVAARLGVQPPRVRVVAELGSPVVWSLGRATLAWPANEEGIELEPDDAIVAHELAHLRRRDHWVAWLEVCALCALWWNPVFWFVHRRMRECAELACDAWVVEVYPEKRRRYAESLIDAAEGQTHRVCSAPALGATDSNVNTFRRRLEMILRDRVRSRVSPAALAAASAFAVLVLPVRPTSGAPAMPPAPGDETSVLTRDVQEAVATEIATAAADRAFGAGRWEEAAEAYRRVLRLRPDDGRALHRLGYSLLATRESGARAEAAQVFERQAALGHRVETAEYNLACALALQGKVEPALEHLHRSVHAGFAELELMDADGDLDALREDPRFATYRGEVEKLTDLRRSAKQASTKGEWSTAVAAWAELVEELPRDGAAWRALGDAQLELKQFEAAATSFGRQAELGHDTKRALFDLARLQAQGGYREAALESLEAAVDAGYHDYKVLSVDRALDSLREDERFLKLVEGQWKHESLAREAWNAYDDGAWEQAIGLYEELVEWEPGDGAAWSRLGSALFRQGAYARAVEAYERQAALGHRTQDALVDLACAWSQAGQAELAVAHLERALDLGFGDADRLRRDPDLRPLADEARFHASVMRAADQGFLAKAGAATWSELAERSRDELVDDPENAIACYHLGWACLRLGEYQEAATAFATQAELGHAVGAATYNVACALSLVGEVDEAFEWLERAIEAGMRDPAQLRTDLDLARLREDPRFDAILSRLEQGAGAVPTSNPADGWKEIEKQKAKSKSKSKDKGKDKDKDKGSPGATYDD